MKIQKSRRPAKGFSLMELVVVVSIIVVLAALTLGALNMIRGKQARDTALVQINLLAHALADYNLENRTYPTNADPEGAKGDEVLYKALFYDGFEAKENDQKGGARIYLAELDPQNNTKGGQAWIQGTGAQAKIVDPWGNPYRYRSGDSSAAKNPDFDIWSAGPDGKTNTDPKNAACLDDIKNWSN
ncbi:type II secretion system protein GspG [Haloferula sp. BvORR071]|uniref:type II secretion system protein GspG n=1 Tax=Haloferula sp. BvORR071 TaxID=1396141 RepID=UPI000555128A|nr:type II secretion system protein GspG [Haloferula sp. BvORR071]